MTPYDDGYKTKLPEWVDIMGDSQMQQPDATPFVAALKKRLSTPQMKTGQAGMSLGKAASSEGGLGSAMGGGASL